MKKVLHFGIFIAFLFLFLLLRYRWNIEYWVLVSSNNKNPIEYSSDSTFAIKAFWECHKYPNKISKVVLDTLIYSPEHDFFIFNVIVFYHTTTSLHTYLIYPVLKRGKKSFFKCNSEVMIASLNNDVTIDSARWYGRQWMLRTSFYSPPFFLTNNFFNHVKSAYNSNPYSPITNSDLNFQGD